MEYSLVNLSGTEQTLEAILHTFTDTNFVFAPDGAILDYRANDPALPYTFPTSIHNKKIKDVFPSNVADQLEHALSTVQQTGNVVPLEYALPVSNREYWF